jgi:hypothetical protein
MSRETHEVKRTIIATLESRGEASPRDIVAALGEEWRNEAKQLQLHKMLRRMVRGHVLKNTRYGVYTLSPNYKMRGVSVFDLTEHSIVEFLRERGGIARTKEIQDACGDRQRGGEDRHYDHKRITLTLKESPRFSQDFGRGYWNLDEAERARLPLIGRWADYSIVVGWYERGERGGFASSDEMSADFFDSVGSAFMEARAGMSSAEVALVPEVRAALRVMADRAASAKADARDALREMVEADERARGVTDRFAIAQAVREREAAGGLGEHLYAMFELGDVALHLAAPVEFYRACAALFRVCPARLSRGEIEILSPSLQNLQ